MNIKHLLTLFCLVLIGGLYAQESTKTLVAINAFLYDSEGKETENHFFTVSNGIEEGPDKTFTFYNANGSKKEEVSLNLLNDTVEKVNYQYQINILTRTSNVYYGATSTPQEKIIYYGLDDYSEVDELVVTFLLNIPMYACDSFKVYSWNQGNWELATTGKYTYNQKENPTKLVLMLNDYVPDMKIDLQVVYQYDTKDNCTDMFASVLFFNSPLSLMNVEQTFDASSKLTETYMYPNVNPLLSQYFGTDVTEFLTEQKVRYTYNTNNDIETILVLMVNKDNGTFEPNSERAYVYTSQDIGGTEHYLVDTIYDYFYGTPARISDQSALQIKIYPNPSAEFMYITGIEEEAVVTIYDLNAKLLFVKIVKGADLQIHIQSLTPGMYVVKVQHAKGMYVSKFIKE
ncbi:MAG: T9SS type A sorting domain-containing protein [Bacteroidales bacterium]|nr:T9SS type A sorting domain-containing protein [Bacteroidales bacterium]